MAEIEVTYSVLLDGVEIGFGSSGHWNDIDSAVHAAHSELQRCEWERTAGMPDPKDIQAALSDRRDTP